MAREIFITLSAHHYEGIVKEIAKAKREGKSFEEVAAQHADWLLNEDSGNYQYLSDPVARQKFIDAEAHAMERVESARLYDNGAATVAPNFYTAQDGSRRRVIDWICRTACGNFLESEGVKKCGLDGK